VGLLTEWRRLKVMVHSKVVATNDGVAQHWAAVLETGVMSLSSGIHSGISSSGLVLSSIFILSILSILSENGSSRTTRRLVEASNGLFTLQRHPCIDSMTVASLSGGLEFKCRFCVHRVKVVWPGEVVNLEQHSAHMVMINLQ
jgi:hypothetical protein